MSKNLEEIRGFKNAAIGTIMAWSGSSSELPTGWLSCDGAAVSNDDYPLLKDVIGYTYGGSDAANEFELPNLNNGRVPFHKGSTFIGQGGNNTASTTLNADWSINGRPNKTIQYNAAQVNSNDGNNAFTRNLHFQSRMMSLENLPGHGHNPNIKTLNSQHNGNPSGESGGDITFQTARAVITRGALPRIGGPNDYENNRMSKPPQAHGHEAIRVTVDKGNLSIPAYDETYNSDNMAVTNFPNLGNASLDFTQPYQTAVYIIKAY